MPRFLRSETSVWSVAVVGVVFAAAFVAVKGHPVIEQGLYEVASVALLALFIVGLRRNIPRRSWIWQALSLAVAFEVFGDVAAGFPAAPNPAWLAHALYLAAIPLFAAALVGCMRPRRLRGEGPLPQLLDSAIVFVSGFAVLWFVRVDSHFDRP